jgi:type I restriction enzyme S subunit
MNNAMCNHDKKADWIDAIPNGWQAWKLSHAFIAISSGTTPDSGNSKYYDRSINWINTSELREKVITETEQCVTEEALKQFSSLKIYKPPALLIAMYGATIGQLGLLGKDATVNQACCVLSKPKHLDVKFAFYWFLVNRNNIITLASGGGQPNINQEKIKQLRLSAPKCEVQQTIAQFLDHKTALIDQYIANKQRQLQLLEKLRTSIISEAVTQGLNPDVEMKDSGGKWLGKVPMHWQTYRLRFLLQFNPSKSEVQKLRIENALVTFLPMENVSESGEVNLSDTAKISDVWDGYTYCRNGDVILAKITPCYENGKGAYLSNLVNDVAFGSTEFIVMRPSRDILGKFLYFLTINELFRDMGESQMQGSAGQQRVPLRFLKDFLLWLPNITEQKAIIEYIELETKKVETLIDQLTQQITKMEAYRTSLISEAVTGKIDVRNFKLPATEVSA